MPPDQEQQHPEAARITAYLKGELTREHCKNRWDYHALQKRAEHFSFENNRLCKIIAGGKRARVITTEKEKADVIMAAHVAGGHFGWKPTRAHLVKNVWWFGNMQLDVMAAIKLCKSCPFYNPAQMKVVPPMQHVPYRPEPFNVVAVDIKDLPKTPSGNRHLLVLVDYFSKYVTGVALPNKYQESVAAALTTRLFLAHGSPGVMLSDNGGEFKNGLAKRILSLFNVKPRYITPAHPQANGLCERCNGIITTVLGKIQSADVAVWDERLDEAVFYYNTKENDATGKTPYELVYGKKCTTFVDVILQDSDEGLTDETPRILPSMAAAEEQKAYSRLEEARKTVATAARKRQATKDAANKKGYDKRHRVERHMVAQGDVVLKKVTQLSGKMHGKIGPKWEGPYKVTKVTRTHAHLVAAGKKPTMAPYGNIKKYLGGMDSEN